jgi:UDP-glucose 4-epimerase
VQAVRILLTGGAGSIGSHTAFPLCPARYEVVCFDNLANSKAEAIARLEEITAQPIALVICDVRDSHALECALTAYKIDAVIHFAGLKAVGEPGEKPLLYHDNNVRGTQCLLKAIASCGLRHLVFSSSATVYGEPQYLPLDDGHPTSATNPYGRAELMMEQMLADVATADAGWRIAALRCFNPVGAHPSGLIGEDPNGIPNNLMPFEAQVASGLRKQLDVFGNDYSTPDGTGVSDYTHGMDLAEGHVPALQAITRRDEPYSVSNLGTGTGFSVLEMVAVFEKASGQPLPYTIAPRRSGDRAVCYASLGKARDELGWQARFGLEEMCASTWRFEGLWRVANGAPESAERRA